MTNRYDNHVFLFMMCDGAMDTNERCFKRMKEVIFIGY